MARAFQEISGRKTHLEPVALPERYGSLDIIRGVALFGVLMVNLLTYFRVSIFQHLLVFDTHPGLINRAVDLFSAGLLEFKAVTLYSLLFGVGVSIQAERAAARGTMIGRFLVRRFMALLLIGLCHLFLLSNVDILCLYAVCGLGLIAFTESRTRELAILGGTIVGLSFFIDFSACYPSVKAMEAAAAQATLVYAKGNLSDILRLRGSETWHLILPLVFAWLPRTFGLMLVGMAAWRSHIFKKPEEHLRLLWTIALGGAIVGGAAMAVVTYSEAWKHPHPILIPQRILEACSYVPLAFSYGAALLLILRSRRVSKMMSLIAPLGQMSLTNYLTQSLIFGWVFYGYGLGLFGKLSPAEAAVIGLAVYIAQIAFSIVWLRRFRFGPCEWLWRSMTYGCLQPMRRT